MHHNHVKRVVVVRRAFNHALKFGPIVVSGSQPSFNVVIYQSPAILLTMLVYLPLLVGHGKVTFKLLVG
nr:hypothetical protein [Rhizobium ruizarguesonis]